MSWCVNWFSFWILVCNNCRNSSIPSSGLYKCNWFVVEENVSMMDVWQSMGGSQYTTPCAKLYMWLSFGWWLAYSGWCFCINCFIKTTHGSTVVRICDDIGNGNAVVDSTSVGSMVLPALVVSRCGVPVSPSFNVVVSTLLLPVVDIDIIFRNLSVEVFSLQQSLWHWRDVTTCRSCSIAGREWIVNDTTNDVDNVRIIPIKRP